MARSFAIKNRTIFQIKWNDKAIPGKPIKRKNQKEELSKKEKHKKYEEHRPERTLNPKIMVEGETLANIS